MIVFIVTATYRNAINRNNSTHIVEAFDSEAKAIEYLRSDIAKTLYGDAQLNIVWRQVQ